MTDRYDDERRWRRRNEGWREWEDEEERDWQDPYWRNRPYSRVQGEGTYREGDWRSRQGRMGYGGGYGPDYDREYDREREWGRGRDWERGQNMGRGGGYGARSGDWDRGQSQMRGGYGRYGSRSDWDQERYGRGGYYGGGTSQARDRYGRPWSDRDQEWGRSPDWESEQGSMRSGRQGGRYTGEQDWDYGRMRSGYGGGSGRSFDRDRESYGRGQMGQSDRYQDMDEGEWEEWDEPATTWTYTEYWFVPGPFAGIGPRNYNRSDETILEEVCERLSQHGQIDPSEVEIEVQDGEIILKGSVNDRREKRLAEDIAESVFGVNEVHNQLRTRDRGMGRVSELRYETDRTRREQGMARQQGMADQTRSSTSQGWTGGQGINRDQIRQGMEVIGRDGERVGEVKEVHSNAILVDRPMARDVYVPFSAANMSENRIRLSVKAGEVDNQDWENPDILSTEEEGEQTRKRS